jgi:hypothetical protein
VDDRRRRSILQEVRHRALGKSEEQQKREQWTKAFPCPPERQGEIGQGVSPAEICSMSRPSFLSWLSFQDHARAGGGRAGSGFSSGEDKPRPDVSSPLRSATFGAKRVSQVERFHEIP